MRTFVRMFLLAVMCYVLSACFQWIVADFSTLFGVTRKYLIGVFTFVVLRGRVPW